MSNAALNIETTCYSRLWKLSIIIIFHIFFACVKSFHDGWKSEGRATYIKLYTYYNQWLCDDGTWGQYRKMKFTKNLFSVHKEFFLKDDELILLLSI